jgi:hypothetical protein
MFSEELAANILLLPLGWHVTGFLDTQSMFFSQTFNQLFIDSFISFGFNRDQSPRLGVVPRDLF